MSVASDRPLPDRESHQKYEVTPIELFFDLVFVFAVSQLSHHWLEDMTWRGAVETAVLLLPVLGVWSYTSWAATMIPADRSGTLWMMLSVMMFGLFMNASLTKAFTESAWLFIIPFLLIQLGRTVWTIANAPDTMYREHFVRVLIWLMATTPFWLAGAAADPERRVLYWGFAAAMDLLGTWLAHPVPGRRRRSQDVDFAGGHMLERCRLFLIIALGETVLTTGTAITAVPIGVMTVITGAAALAGTVALWALYFGRAEPLAIQHVERTSNPIRDSRHERAHSDGSGPDRDRGSATSARSHIRTNMHRRRWPRRYTADRFSSCSRRGGICEPYLASPSCYSSRVAASVAQPVWTRLSFTSDTSTNALAANAFASGLSRICRVTLTVCMNVPTRSKREYRKTAE